MQICVQMYPLLLASHSFVRWFVLIALLWAIFRACRGWFGHRPYTRLDDVAKYIAVAVVHVQFIMGLLLYLISPIVSYFFHDFSRAIHQTETRFFGMEHSTMMLIAVTVISVGAMQVKGKGMDKAKFRAMAIWFSVGLLLILTSIPWAFSPFTSRPYFRLF